MKYRSLKQIGMIVSQLSYDIFLIVLGGYITSLALESMKPGVVVRYFNLNHLLLIVMISGLSAIILPHPMVPSQHKRLYTTLLVVGSCVVGLIVFQLLASLGVWSYIVCTASVLLLCSVGILLEKDS